MSSNLILVMLKRKQVAATAVSGTELLRDLRALGPDDAPWALLDKFSRPISFDGVKAWECPDSLEPLGRLRFLVRRMLGERFVTFDTAEGLGLAVYRMIDRHAGESPEWTALGDAWRAMMIHSCDEERGTDELCTTVKGLMRTIGAALKHFAIHKLEELEADEPKPEPTRSRERSRSRERTDVTAEGGSE